MINYQEIIQYIKDDKITIFYSFEKDNNGVKILDNEFECDFEDASSDFCKKLLYSDRLKLTLGPVIKSHQQTFKSKSRYNNSNDCTNILNSNNEYILKPKESITILTNERIKLNKNVSAIILPKVSLSEIGIHLTPAYIDPFYNGILRLLVTNTTNKSYKFNALDVIAQCYFFKLSDGIPDSFKDEFPQKSVFYGQNWNSILNEEADPFPTRKKPYVKYKLINDFLLSIKSFWLLLQKNALITSIIIFVIGFTYSFGKFNEKLKVIDSNKILLDTINKISVDNKSILKDLSSNFKTNTTEIVIPKNQKYGEKKVFLNIKASDIIGITIKNRNIDYELFSGNDLNKSYVIFKYKLDNTSNKQQHIRVEFLISKKIND